LSASDCDVPEAAACFAGSTGAGSDATANGVVGVLSFKHGAPDAGNGHPAPAGDVDGDGKGDKDSLLPTVVSTNTRLLNVLDQYSARTAQCNAVVAKQNRDLVISDILRLSSSTSS
jgi:hypothetical protein